jgi:hypothetical protein
VGNNIKLALCSRKKSYYLSFLQLSDSTHAARPAVLSAFGSFLHDDKDNEDLL